jgi:GTP-binding protein HflX
MGEIGDRSGRQAGNRQRLAKPRKNRQERQKSPLSKKSRRRKQSARNEITFQIEERKPTRAYVLHVDVRAPALRHTGASRNNSNGENGHEHPPAAARRPAARQLEEAVSLARAIDLDIRGREIVPLARLTPATLIGAGKVEEISHRLKEAGAELVIVNAHLTPGQQRNLEKAWDVKVLDRTGLILEIFGRRARTREGRLQVELAHLEYQKTRLVRSWTHLERQRGGFGFMGGPGETQIEADRRMIRERIARIRRQLEQVVRTRELHRKARRRVPYPVVALAGYTNAGKSTLFNRLTRASVHAADQLFATLDPTMRLVRLPHGRQIILSDTVGFISDLPTTLVAAFRATLEEVIEADVILHVRDMTDEEEAAAQAADVEQVLADLGIGEERRARMIEVWNKADLLSPAQHERLTELAARRGAVLVSAATGEGLESLLHRIETLLGAEESVRAISLAPHEGAEMAWLYRHGEVLRREEGENGLRFLVRFSSADLARAERRFGGRLHLPGAEDGSPAQAG